MKKFLLGVAAGLIAVTGLALADVYYGYNPSTGLEVTHGALVDGGTAVVISGSSGCGTLTAKAAGADTGTVTIGTFSSSCAITLTFPSAAPNGWTCQFVDATTPADSPHITQASSSTTTCVGTAGTIVTGDKLFFTARGF